MEMMTYTKESLEEYSDQVKIAIMTSLVSEKILEQEAADEWCANHTVILRKKSIFRTLTDKWLKSEKERGDFILIVKRTS
jgi:hypothetical protein